jgi:hypothetical protein
VFLLAGVMLVLLAVGGSLVRSLRRLESDVPDADTDTAPETVTGPAPEAAAGTAAGEPVSDSSPGPAEHVRS